MADTIFLTAYNAAVSLKFILSFNDELRQDFSDQRKMCFSWGTWIIWLRKKTFWSVQRGSKKTTVLVERILQHNVAMGVWWQEEPKNQTLDTVERWTFS